MRATDWASTRLGPVERWPQSLRTMLGVVLGSRFPMMLWWGPDLLQLYNDAYRPILRDKHPASLAAPAQEVWAEVWDVAGPMARSVQEGGPATWTEDLQLFVKSGEMAEEAYFTFSFSPVPGDDGRVGGLLQTVQETTTHVRGERQIRMLHDLGRHAAEARSERDAYAIAAGVLAGNELDLPFVLLYAPDGHGEVQLVAAGGSATKVRPPASAWPLADAERGREPIVVDELPEALPAGTWNAAPERVIVLPLGSYARGMNRAFLVAGLSPHRVLDDRYRQFLAATADQVAKVITSARAHEAETKRAEALTEVDRAKTTFFSNVSHEFRTPLTLILGPIEEALALRDRSLRGESLDVVHRSSLRLLRLVTSLLDFSRLEAGRLAPSFVRADVAKLTVDLASSFRSLVERAGLSLVVDCPPIEAAVYIDPSHWEKIVLNLVSNAFKFTLAGRIEVRLAAAAGFVTLTVSDTGTGIPAAELPRIFERFHRVDGAKGRSFEGTGIGLALVRDLVGLHGGTVRATSVEGEGSTFEVVVPLGSTHLPSDRIVDAAGAATSITAAYLLEASQWIGPGQLDRTQPPAHGALRSNARVLVVDDNADMREYIYRLLSPRWTFELAANGKAALAMALESPPDLVLSDVMMPGLDGFGLLTALRGDERTARVPVVLLSARTGEEVVTSLESGADDYLVKPFAARELLARVQTHLELARARRDWARQLEDANKELEAFSYSVSHDLRTPLRAIDGFSKILLAEYAESLGEQGRHYLERVRAGSQRMGQLIDDFIGLAQVSRKELRRERVDLGAMARAVAADLRSAHPQRSIVFVIDVGLIAYVDRALLEVVFENLLGNAVKFTSKRERARIEVGKLSGEEPTFFVRDDGAGFDMRYVERLFNPFQRLHDEREFAGTGVGLATVGRIVTRHGGRIWAEAAVERGAAFFFTLGEPA